MASEATFLSVQFLRWVSERPRRHAELREAWSSTCPLNCAWEDAVSDDLVRYAADGTLVLTERGRERLSRSELGLSSDAALIDSRRGVS